MEPFACVDGNGGRYPLSGPTRRVEKTAAAQGQRSFSPRIGGDFFGANLRERSRYLLCCRSIKVVSSLGINYR